MGIITRSITRYLPVLPRPTLNVVKPQRIIFLDTETTGLNVASEHLLSLGFVVTDKSLNVLESSLLYVKPDGFLVKAQHIHGLSDEFLARHGHSVSHVLQVLSNAMKTCQVVCAHNARFDKGILTSEYERRGKLEDVELLQSLKTLDTARHKAVREYYGKKLGIKTPGIVGQEKLYNSVFGRAQEGAHTAENDVANLLDIVKYFVREGVLDSSTFLCLQKDRETWSYTTW